MKNAIKVGFIACCCLCFVFQTGYVAAVEADHSVTFFVSVDGHDSFPGSRKTPFATLQKAQQAVAQCIQKGLKGDVSVYVDAGEYVLDQPLVFGAEDGGSYNCKVTYIAQPGVVVSGGREITGWKKQGDGAVSDNRYR